MRRLLPLVLAALALAPALPAHAAGARLELADPAGDQLDVRASMDIVEVTMDTKKIKPTDPTPSIVITMKLSAAPEPRLTSYAVEANIPGCGPFNAIYAPGTLLNQVSPQSPASVFVCNGGTDPTDTLDLFSPKFAVSKDTMTWTIALDSLPKVARAGKKFTDLWAYTEISDPVTGLSGNANLTSDATPHPAGSLPTDDLSSDKTFTFA